MADADTMKESLDADLVEALLGDHQIVTAELNAIFRERNELLHQRMQLGANSLS